MNIIEDVVLDIIAFNAALLAILYYLSMKAELPFEKRAKGQVADQRMHAAQYAGRKSVSSSEEKAGTNNWDMSDGDLGI
jgi:hypothetical protein